LFRHTGHTLLLWATSEAAWGEAMEVAEDVIARSAGRLRAVVVVPEGLSDTAVFGATLVDADGNLATAYGFGDAATTPAAYLIRPDGYVSYRSAAVDEGRVLAHLATTTLQLPGA
jgi:hypothetical protein